MLPEALFYSTQGRVKVQSISARGPALFILLALLLHQRATAFFSFLSFIRPAKPTAEGLALAYHKAHLGNPPTPKQMGQEGHLINQLLSLRNRTAYYLTDNDHSLVRNRPPTHRSLCAIAAVYWLSLVLLLVPHGLQPARLLCPRDFSGKNTGVGCHILLQGNFPTQGSIPCFLLGRWIR